MTQISQLTPAPAVSATDVVPLERADGTTYAASAQQIVALGVISTATVAFSVANVAAIGGFIGNSPLLQTSGLVAAGDGGSAFYTQTNTGWPTAGIADGLGRLWYFSDIYNDLGNLAQVCKSDGTDIGPQLQLFCNWLASVNKGLFIPAAPSTSVGWTQNTPISTTILSVIFERGARINWLPKTTTFTASFAPNGSDPTGLTGTMTVTSAVTGIALAIGMALYGTGQTPVMITAGSGTSWTVSKPFTLASTTIYAAADLTSAFTFTSGLPVVEDATFTGPDGAPTASTLMSSGWILALATGVTGTQPAANQFQFTSGNGQNIIVGCQIIGSQVLAIPGSGPAAGLTTSPVVTVTAVNTTTGGATASNPILTLSASLVTFTGSPTFTFHNLPNYSAICSGVAAITFAGNCQPVMTRMGGNGCKVGFVMNTYGGHSDFRNNNPSGAIFGAYWQADGGDNHVDLGVYNGGLASIGFGNSHLSNASCFVGGGLAGHIQRIQGTFIRPYSFYQVSQNGLTTGNSLSGEHVAVRHEAVTEAAILCLPGAVCALELDNCSANFNSSGGTGQLPSTIISNPRTAMFSLGSINSLQCNGNNISNTTVPFVPDASGGGAYAQFTFVGTGNLGNGAPFEPWFLGTPTNIAQTTSVLHRWTTQRGPDVVSKGDLGVGRDLAVSGNLLNNPEAVSTGTTAKNWVLGASVVVTNTSYTASDLPALGVLLAQEQIETLGPNPIVSKVVIAVSGNAGAINLRAAQTALPLNQTFWGRGWGVIPLNVAGGGTQASFAVETNLLMGSGGATRCYDFTGTPPLNAWTAYLGVNKTPAYWGDATGILYGFRLFPSGTGTMYLIGIQAGVNEIGPYCADPAPTSLKPLKLPVYTVATLPTGYGAGSQAFVSDATTPTYNGTLTGGGAVFCRAVFNGTTWQAG